MRKRWPPDGDIPRRSEAETRRIAGPEGQILAEAAVSTARDTRDPPRDDTTARLEQSRPDVGDRRYEAGLKSELSDLIADENVGAFREVGVEEWAKTNRTRSSNPLERARSRARLMMDPDSMQ